MGWWMFVQNNPGGVYKGPAMIVMVNAETASQANDKAEDVGVYFDGVATHDDCACCGDRWDKMYFGFPAFPEREAAEKCINENWKWMEKRGEEDNVPFVLWVE